MRTKLFCLALCLALALSALPFALGEAEAAGQMRRLRLGSSIYTIEIDGSFQYGPVTEADAADGQVAYLYSDALAVDFDIYQLGVAGGQLPLAEYVAEEAAARGDADGIVTDGEINGIPVGWYYRVETWNDVDYRTVTYVLDDGEGFVEVVFWLDGEDAEAVARGMIDTLAVDNLAPVRLGTSPYYLFCSASFREGGMTSADVAEGQVAYWLSDETLLDFDVYQRSKEGLPQRLADYVAGEAAAYHADAVEAEAEVNGIPVGWYRTVESWEGEDYETLTCVLDAGDDYVVIVFWLDGLTAGAEADAILHSLWRDDAPEADDTAQAEGAAQAATRTLRLGSSPFTLTVPAGFVEGEMTQEDIEDDQVAYWYSNDTLLDFDVYQFSKDGYPDALAVFVEDEISGYNEVTDLVKDGEVNGIPAARYRTVEEYQDVAFNTLTYILDGGNEYVEVVFWLDGETADAEADAIIRTLKRDDGDAPIDGDGAVLVEAEEEISTARRTSAEAPEAEVGEALMEEAYAPGDGSDAIDAGTDEAGE